MRVIPQSRCLIDQIDDSAFVARVHIEQAGALAGTSPTAAGQRRARRELRCLRSLRRAPATRRSSRRQHQPPSTRGSFASIEDQTSARTICVV